MRAGLLILFVWAGFAVSAQDIRLLVERHARISSLYEQQKYAEVVREIDAQIKEAPGTSFADSLHRYLYKYGRAHRKLKDAAAGVEAAERIYGLVKQRSDANHELEALFDLSWTYYDVGEMKQCARVDSTAVTVADRDPKVPIGQRGRARQYLAFDYSVLGDHRNSAKWAVAAIAQYEKADSIPPAQWAESYTAAGVANWHMGRIRDAEAYYLKALEILGDGEEEAILIRKVSTNGNLGVLWQNAGDFTRAKNFYHASLRFSDRVIAATKDQFTRDEAVVNRSRTYLNLATVYHQLGDHGRARALLDVAFLDRSGVLEADDPQLLVVQDRLADLELSAGNLEKAEELTGAYLTACERKFGRRSEEYIRAASKLGDIAERKGEVARADSLFSLSIASGKANTDEATDAVLVQTLQSRARLHMRTRQFDEALAELLHARAILVRIYESAHYKVADADLRLAEAAFTSDRFGASLGYARSALSIVDDRVRAARTGHAPEALPDPHILPDAVYWTVRAERELSGGAMKPEWSELIDLAVRSLARNKGALEDEASKLLLIGAQKRLFDLAMDITYDAYAKSHAPKDLERFLQLSEADRSILLKSRLNAFAGIRFAGLPDSIITREQELIAALDVDDEDRSSASDLLKNEQAYADFIARLERDHPVYFNLRYGEATVTLADLRQRLLKENRQLVSYVRTSGSLYALIIGPKEERLVRLEADGLGDKVRALNQAIAARDKEAYVQAARALEDIVHAPLASRITAHELLIIPDGELHAVNFEVLLTGTGNGDFRKDLLLQRYAIAYLLSATTALQFAELKRERSSRVLAIAPGFSDELKQDYLVQVQDSALVDRRFLRYVRQPFAMSTARDLGGSLSAKVMVGGEASEAGFREQAAQFGILHLGTHAEMNAASPMYSRLVLSKDGAGVDADADGYLHAYEIYELDLRAQLAVLTACETGTGRNDDGEGVRSLGYSFAYAGCPSLVMSLWSIDEKVSSEIIARFYEHLADGMPKHEALRQAKLDQLGGSTDELALPYYWAGMVLVGDVEPVDLGGSVWPWVVGPLVMLALVLLLFRGRNRAA